MAETTFRAPQRVALLLAVMGVVLLIADRISKQDRGITQVKIGDAIIIGIAQAFAIMPGVSRSGATIAAGLFCGLDRASSARFSFLLSFPIIAGATLFGCRDLAGGLPAGEGLNFALAIIASGITGFAAIDFLLKFLQRRSVVPFVIYRIALAALVFAIVLWRGS
jgi:undecaprenyl-diphosphatase